MKQFISFSIVALCFFCASTEIFAQFNTPTINGAIVAGEYGSHVDGQNQKNTGSAQTWWFKSPRSARFALPLDGGRTFRGRRLFGSNKTWKGFVVMVPGVPP